MAIPYGEYSTAPTDKKRRMAAMKRRSGSGLAKTARKVHASRATERARARAAIDAIKWQVKNFDGVRVAVLKTTGKLRTKSATAHAARVRFEALGTDAGARLGTRTDPLHIFEMLEEAIAEAFQDSIEELEGLIEELEPE